MLNQFLTRATSVTVVFVAAHSAAVPTATSREKNAGKRRHNFTKISVLPFPGCKWFY
jgi:hypothetical protein